MARVRLHARCLSDEAQALFVRSSERQTAEQRIGGLCVAHTCQQEARYGEVSAHGHSAKRYSSFKVHCWPTLASAASPSPCGLRTQSVRSRMFTQPRRMRNPSM